MQKQTGFTIEVKSVEEAACVFVDELARIKNQNIVNPWAQHRPSSGSKQASSSSTSMVLSGDDVRSFSYNGVLIESDIAKALLDKGLKIGMLVASKSKASEKLTLESISVGDRQVVLSNSDGSTNVPVSKFVAQYAPFTENFLELNKKNDARHNHEFSVSAIKAGALYALHSLALAAPAPAVKIMQKPLRKVFAGDNYKTKMLVLVPEACSVQMTEKEVPATASRIEINFEDAVSHKYKFYMTPPPVNPEKLGLVAPYWLLRMTENEAEANMKQERRVVQITTLIKHGPKAAADEKAVVEEMAFTVYTNKKNITIGEELVLFAKKGGDAEAGAKRRKVS